MGGIKGYKLTNYKLLIPFNCFQIVLFFLRLIKILFFIIGEPYDLMDFHIIEIYILILQ